MGLLDDLGEIIKRLDALKKNRPYLFFVSADSKECMEAMISGDSVRIKNINDKMEKQSAKRKAIEYDRMRSWLAPDYFEVFTKIDSEYRSSGISKSPITNSKETYSYQWFTNIKLPAIELEEDGEKYWELGEVYIVLRKGKFNLELSYDDGGYGGRRILSEDMQPHHLINHLEDLKKVK